MFIESQKNWILKKQEFILNNNIQPPLKFINGEKHQLWGREYTLQLIQNDNIKHVLIDENINIMYLPLPKKVQ